MHSVYILVICGFCLMTDMLAYDLVERLFGSELFAC